MRRREFLIRTAGTAGVAALAAGPLAAWRDAAKILGEGTRSNWPFSKCLALGGPQAQGGTPSLSLYSQAPTGCAGADCANAPFIELSNTSWIKIQVSWWQLQELWGPPAIDPPAGYVYPEKLPPANWAESWHHLNFARNINEIAGLDAVAINAGIPALRRLDREIAAANRGGVRVLLSLYHDFPTWTASRAEPVDPSRAFHGEIWNGVPPDDLSTDGPWAWFIGHLLARYRPGAPRNPIGPHFKRGKRHLLAGNPDGAVIDALEICNEPNTLLEAVDPSEPVARMISSALAIGSGEGPVPTGRVRIPLLAPATADEIDQSVPGKMSWDEFTTELIARLDSAQIRPGSSLRWSQHNYADVKRPIGEGRDSRAGITASRLRGRGWIGANARPLWLTEGGYRLPKNATPDDEQIQARRLAQNYLSMSSVPELALWTQYKVAAGDSFDSGLRRAPEQGLPGPARPAWEVWRDLPSNKG